MRTLVGLTFISILVACTTIYKENIKLSCHEMAFRILNADYIDSIRYNHCLRFEYLKCRREENLNIDCLNAIEYTCNGNVLQEKANIARSYRNNKCWNEIRTSD